MTSLFVDVENVDPEKDLPDVRELKLYSRTVRFQRRNPYGFIYISIDKGKVPDKLSGAYTSFDQALLAAKNYYENEEKKRLTPITKAQ